MNEQMPVFDSRVFEGFTDDAGKAFSIAMNIGYRCHLPQGPAVVVDVQPCKNRFKITLYLLPDKDIA